MVGQPICGVPGAHVTLRDRESDDYYWTQRLLKTETPCLNLGSYNYLGFGDDWHVTCKQDVMASLEAFPVSKTPR